jgi:hypothetical protein
MAFGTDPGAEFIKLAEKTMEQIPLSAYASPPANFSRTNFLTAWLHNQTTATLALKGQADGPSADGGWVVQVALCSLLF